MGIVISGGMFVGAKVSDIVNGIPEDFEHGEYEVGFVEYLTEYLSDDYSDCMDLFSPWYDANEEDCWVGYRISEVHVDLLDEKWLKKIHKLGKKFEEITGTKASLIGMQDVY